MEKTDTIIVAGQRRIDEYGNLWVAPAGGGEEIKIAAKRSQLHPLFQQEQAIVLHWATYKNIPYVTDAELVEGKLPPPVEPQVPDDYPGKEEIPPIVPPQVFAPQEIGLWYKEVGKLYRADLIKKDTPEGLALIAAYFLKMKQVLGITVEKK